MFNPLIFNKMKNLGIQLTNHELLNIRGGAQFTCNCESGGEYIVQAANLAEAEATLTSTCSPPNPQDWCEEDIPN